MDAAFLKAPNQMSTRWSSCSPAAAICASTELKSKVPSTGSTCAQLALPITVPMPCAASRCHTGRMCSALEALELCS